MLDGVLANTTLLSFFVTIWGWETTLGDNRNMGIKAIAKLGSQNIKLEKIIYQICRIVNSDHCLSVDES